MNPDGGPLVKDVDNLLAFFTPVNKPHTGTTAAPGSSVSSETTTAAETAPETAPETDDVDGPTGKMDVDDSKAVAAAAEIVQFLQDFPFKKAKTDPASTGAACVIILENNTGNNFEIQLRDLQKVEQKKNRNASDPPEPGSSNKNHTINETVDCDGASTSSSDSDDSDKTLVNTNDADEPVMMCYCQKHGGSCHCSPARQNSAENGDDDIQVVHTAAFEEVPSDGSPASPKSLHVCRHCRRAHC